MLLAMNGTEAELDLFGHNHNNNNNSSSIHSTPLSRHSSRNSHGINSGRSNEEASSQQEHTSITATHITSNNTSILTPVTLCILGTETAERFAYFGFRAVLVLYFTVSLQYTETQAIALFSFNSSLAYLSPLLGAILADGWWGRYRVILYFGTVYCVGLALLSWSAASASTWSLVGQRCGTFAGLFLVCVGTGGIKPCVSAFGADQVYLPALTTTTTTTAISDHDETEEQQQQRSSDHVRTFFNYFYFCINVGAVTSIALVPLLRSWKGFGLAFFVPCLFMMGAMLLFLSRRHEYRHQPVGAAGAAATENSTNITNNRMLMTFQLAAQLLVRDVCSSTWMSRYCGRFQQWYLSGSRRRLVPTTETRTEVVRGSIHHGPNTRHDQYHDNNDDHEHIFDTKTTTNNNNNNDSVEQDSDDSQWQELVDDARQTLHILPVLLMFPIFWTLYDQQGSVWTLQATRMYLPLGMQPEQMNVINPIEILIFVPLFDQILYPRLEGRGVNIRPVRRMAWGMGGAAVAFFLSALVESAIEQAGPEQPVHVFWQLPQITVLAVAEILLSVTGLEFSYAGAPDRLKAALTALFLSTTAIGDVFSGILYSTVFEHMDRSRALHVCAVLMLVNLRLFLWVAHWYEEHCSRGDWHKTRQNKSATVLDTTGLAMERLSTVVELELQMLQRNVV